jgi:thioredoxin reductase (NADPH)
MRYDIVVIGGGPAGLSAAITARKRNATVCVISNPITDNPLARSRNVPNYPGLPDISGKDLLQKMCDQAADQGTDFCWQQALSVLATGSPENPAFSTSTNAGQVLTSSRLILAAGVARGSGLRDVQGASADLIPGEADYLGRGVSYCATCDGMFYKGRTAALLNLSAEAPKEAEFLVKAGVELYLVTKKSSQLAADYPGLADNSACHLVEGAATGISGDTLGVTGLTVTDKDGQARELAVAGVFILRPTIAIDSLIKGLALTEDGYVQVDAAMRTNIPGLYAAGDITGKPLQVAKAAGQGQVAVLDALGALG